MQSHEIAWLAVVSALIALALFIAGFQSGNPWGEYILVPSNRYCEGIGYVKKPTHDKQENRG